MLRYNPALAQHILLDSCVHCNSSQVPHLNCDWKVALQFVYNKTSLKVN